MNWKFVIVSFLLALATAARADQDDFVYPSSIAVDQHGGIYVVDREASSVFKIAAKAEGLTVIARGQAKPLDPLYRLAGIAVSSNGEVAVSSPATSNIFWLRDGVAVPVGGPDSSKTPFGRPQGLAFDAMRNLIATDLGEEAVVNISNGQVRRIAAVRAPMGVCVDKNGNIVVVSAGRRRLVSIDKQGRVTEIAAGDPFRFPLSVAAYNDGTLVVADTYAKALFKVSRGAKPVVFVKGEPFQRPTGVALAPDGNALVVDPLARAVFRVSADGVVSTIYRAKK